MKQREEERQHLIAKNQEKKYNSMLRKKALRQDDRQRINYLREKNQEKSQLVDEVKEALREDQEQRKEIAMLRKMDQEENHNRAKNFHKMYLQKVAESILEKAARADQIKM